MTVNSKNLCSRLLGKKTVKVKNENGAYDEFEIQRVSATEFVSTKIEDVQKFVGKTLQEIQQILSDDMNKKTLKEAIGSILVKGVISPKIVEKELDQCDVEKEIPIDVLLIDTELSSNLYTEILKLSVHEAK